MVELYREIEGDVLQPVRQVEKSRIVILSNASNVGNWDTALAKRISELDTAPETAFKQWFADTVYEDRSGDQIAFSLGSIQITPFKPVPGAAVCSLIGYDDVSDAEEKRSPIRYHAIAKGLTDTYMRLAQSVAQGHKVEVAVSEQFAAGGSWKWVAVLIKELAEASGVPTTFYK